MKIISVILMATFLIFITNAQEWHFQNPLISPYGLMYVHFPVKDTGYAVGGFGNIIKTTDGGNNWVLLRVDYEPFSHLGGVFFTDSKTGFAYNYKFELLKTIDGGISWTTQQFERQIFCIHFPNKNVGYLGVWNKIYKTTDGGNIWTEIMDEQFLIQNIFFINADTGYVILSGASNKYLKTNNGGETWDLSSSLETACLSIRFINDTTGFIFSYNWIEGGKRYSLLKTTNGGNSWTLKKIRDYKDDQPKGLSGIYFVDKNNGYGYGYMNIIKTINGGETWTELIYPGSNHNDQYFGGVSSMHFIDKDNGVAVGGHLILKTENGGDTWKLNNMSITNHRLYSICFTDANEGFVVGANGTILRVDPLNNWYLINSGTQEDLHSVLFTSKDTGFVVGSNSKILKTTDSGSSWEILEVERICDFHSVFFPNSTIGYACGSNKIIYKTIDGGKNWVKQNYQSNFTEDINLRSAYFFDQNNGFIVGTRIKYDYRTFYYGIILQTTDGGQNWIEKQLGEFGLNSIFFINSDTGYIVGDEGVMLQTVDGGKNWIHLDIEYVFKNYPCDLHSVYFINRDLGYAAGEDYIIKTTDAGGTWEGQYLGTSLFSILFNDSIGYAIGSMGTILTTGTIGTLHNMNEQVIIAGDDQKMIRKIEEKKIIIYPNPSKGLINLKLHDPVTEGYIFELFNVMGKLIYKKEYKIITYSSVEQVDLSQYPKGIYFVRFRNKNQTQVKKIILQ